MTCCRARSGLRSRALRSLASGSGGGGAAGAHGVGPAVLARSGVVGAGKAQRLAAAVDIAPVAEATPAEIADIAMQTVRRAKLLAVFKEPKVERVGLELLSAGVPYLPRRIQA